MSKFEWVRLISLVGFAILILPAVIATNRGRGTWLRNAAIWLAVLVALVFLYNEFGGGADGPW